ncbi:MAG: hypothetical protein ACE5HE_09595, partial [Phycisphaerae bacterium]
MKTENCRPVTARGMASHVGIALALVFCTSESVAYPTYSQNRDATNCRACHGDFRASFYVSLSDGQNWGNLHNLHRSTMLTGDCNTCHGTPFWPLALGSSNGGNGFAPIGCTGCHGREEDMGNDGLSPGRGAGLRQHHWNSGIRLCGNCHSDANPANYLPVGEDVLPSYYFSPDPNHASKPTDACSPNGEEDYAGSLEGLDNDGDGLYDTNDPDCAGATCGNGVVEAGEECDDGNTVDGDCCSADCTFEPTGSSCADADVCNGDEVCDGAGFCQPGTALVCDDSDVCNGVETCDPASGCQAGTPLTCDDGDVCN